MNTFIGFAALLTLLVLVWLVRPLFKAAVHSGISSAKLNTAIHRDQLAALEADLARGQISQQDFEATRDELQLRLLDDTQGPEAAPADLRTTFWSARRTAIALFVTVPVIAVALYMALGTPASIDPVATAHSNDQQIKQMIDTLAAKLKANPDNPKGWAMLARSYKVMGKFDEARQAYEKTGTLLNTEPDLLVDYADILAVQADNNLEGKPLEMVNKALALNPQHPMGLMMSGVAAYRRGDYKMAIAQWEKLLILLEPGSADAKQVEENIADAQTKAGITPAAKSSVDAESGKLPPVPAGAAAGMTPEMIKQMVDRLAERLKANPGDLPGWARLARAYKVEGRTAEALDAYAKAGKLMDSDPDLLTQYVDLLVTQSNGNFKGKPTELINKALALNPIHPTALMMAGQAAFQAADYPKAIKYWETVLTILPPESPDVSAVKSEIAAAKAKSGKS